MKDILAGNYYNAYNVSHNIDDYISNEMEK